MQAAPAPAARPADVPEGRPSRRCRRFRRCRSARKRATDGALTKLPSRLCSDVPNGDAVGHIGRIGPIGRWLRRLGRTTFSFACGSTPLIGSNRRNRRFPLSQSLRSRSHRRQGRRAGLQPPGLLQTSKPPNIQTSMLIENFCPFYRYFSMKGLFWADESPILPSQSPQKCPFPPEKRGIPSLSLKTFALFTVTFQWKAN